MKTKYIVISDGDKELLFTFPEAVWHKTMFECVQMLRNGADSRDWNRPYALFKCVGAGFIENDYCVGKSESLGIASRPKLDTALWRNGSAN